MQLDIKVAPEARLLWIVVLCLSLLTTQTLAQSQSDDAAEGGAEGVETDPTESATTDVDGSLDDADSSISIEEEERGISLEADVRTEYSGSDTDNRDRSNEHEDVLRARWRVTGTAGINPYVRGAVRVAGLCSDIECEPNFVVTDYIPTSSGMADGDITLDKAFIHWYRLETFNVAVGRMQTKFVARGGVFAKSLDRNNSNNTNVNWVDGMHATYQSRRGWVSHLIVQHNAPEGATEIRRGPLDFHDDDSRASYFVGFENLKRTPLVLQRGLDISYLPQSLLKDGTQTGRREDYYGIVLRSANRWTERDEGTRLRVAGELGYAPETQTRVAAGLSGSGDADGLAWNVVVSLMDFKPDHSIGLNHGQVGAGWLLSPQFRENESLAEIRYQWRRSRDLALDFRVRQRSDLEQLAGSAQRQKELDFFVRLTWGGTLW